MTYPAIVYSMLAFRNSVDQLLLIIYRLLIFLLIWHISMFVYVGISCRKVIAHGVQD